MDKNGESNQKLGDFSLKLTQFPHLEKELDVFASQSFLEDEAKCLNGLNALLLRLIQEQPSPCFLLGAVMGFISAVLERKWLSSYTFSQFEFWLNHFSGLSAEDNYLVRGKITGKFIPREIYQILFPIGMGKVHFGSHYVTAHNSPDLDTTVASFWGWVDAFSARVGEGLHLWNVPGGAPDQVEIDFLFYQIFGGDCFKALAKTRSALSVSALDLVTQKGVIKKQINASVEKIDYERDQNVVMLVDEEGSYLGDWRQLDVEGVRKITILLNHCLRAFANDIQRNLTSLFSLESLTKDHLSAAIHEIFSARLFAVEPVKEFTDKQKARVQDYLVKVLGVEKGGESTFYEFWIAMQKIPLPAFSVCFLSLEELSKKLFDQKGCLLEDRSTIFKCLEKIIASLEQAIQSLRLYVDQLGVAFAIKKEVFSYPSREISYRAEVEELKMKIGSFSYLTVTSPTSHEKEQVMGIVRSEDLFKNYLGTVSLRDFCNRDETKVPSYLEVVSVIDHHKSVLSTSSAPVAFIADSQSANALVAELSFVMHDQYSVSGFSEKELEHFLQRYQQGKNEPAKGRLLQRLLQKERIFKQNRGFFIDSHREYLEYLHYLYAILDDTDLLSKVSYRDVTCVASLLNRLKSLQLNKEVEVIAFDDLIQDRYFASKAAKRILQNEEMYSLYKKIYSCKEEAIERSLRLSVQGEASSIFADTKVQNGCCRVGQTKLFAKNFAFYSQSADAIRSLWTKEAVGHYEERNECDLHIHMISTVPSAEDVYQGHEGGYVHKDELWIWIPLKEEAIAHLKSFLSAFKNSPQLVGQAIEVEFLGGVVKELEQIFHESFMPVTKKSSVDKKISAPVAILRYRAGLLNSRKAMISPYLPKLAS